MSKRWAAIVYGRSYHLDFRFITLPYDFTTEDSSWALQHIIATMQQARNLANAPRWSLFKRDNYCVVGVTCMVRDLIDVMVKDDRGRPLYVFVGYVTQLDSQQKLQIPPYGGNDIDRFKVLYREIEPVWSIKDYERSSRSPLLSQYQTLNFPLQDLSALPDHQIPQLNDRSKYPDKTYLWQSTSQQNQLLWLTSAECSGATSTCLNIKGKALVNSPFLNQTVADLDGFQIRNRIVISKPTQALTSQNLKSGANSSLSQKISLRAKEDLDLTLQQAAKLAVASQELFDNFADWSNVSKSNPDVEARLDTSIDEADSFGFKTKKPSSTTNDRDWF